MYVQGYISSGWIPPTDLLYPGKHLAIAAAKFLQANANIKTSPRA